MAWTDGPPQELISPRPGVRGPCLAQCSPGSLTDKCPADRPPALRAQGFLLGGDGKGLDWLHWGKQAGQSPSFFGSPQPGRTLACHRPDVGAGDLCCCANGSPLASALPASWAENSRQILRGRWARSRGGGSHGADTRCVLFKVRPRPLCAGSVSMRTIFNADERLGRRKSKQPAPRFLGAPTDCRRGSAPVGCTPTRPLPG